MRRLQLRQDDAQRLQRAIGQVAEAQAAGTLPPIAWHDGLGEAERAELGMRWPVSTALLDDVAQRHGAWQSLSSEASRLLFPLRELLTACRAQPDAVLTVVANALASACFGSPSGLSGTRPLITSANIPLQMEPVDVGEVLAAPSRRPALRSSSAFSASRCRSPRRNLVHADPVRLTAPAWVAAAPSP